MGAVTGDVDLRLLSAAIGLAGRGRGQTLPNPNVGCIIAHNGRVIGQGWTQPGGRPHAEAMALAQAGPAAKGATAYVSLEPCAHHSARGPNCADSLIEAGVARVAAAMADPDPRTGGKGFDRLRAAGIAVDRLRQLETHARASMAGWLMRREQDRPHVTLKLAISLDGCIALANGESRWITGTAARAHGHGERARANLIVVGRGTLEADAPTLDVRLPGLETRSPRRAVLGHGAPPQDWLALESPETISDLPDIQYVLVEGGAGAAAAFVKADLVDRLLVYRAPILIGGGRVALADIGLGTLSAAHGRWRATDRRRLGDDTLEIFERVREG